MRRPFIIIIALLVAAPASASAQEAAPAHTILAYGKVGGLIPVTDLGPHVTVRLGGGYVLPVLNRRLAVVADLGYSQTSADGRVDDPRVGTGDAEAQFSYTLTQKDLNMFLGPQYFFLDPRHWIVPYAALGLDLHFLKSEIEGTGGTAPLGDNSETSTKAGFAVRGGAGYRLGPGIITGEITFAWAPIDHDITGDSHLGRIAILLGYTAMLGF